MKIDRRWLVGDDGVMRPVVEGALETAAGNWEKATFLVDSGADRTVIRAEVFGVLGLAPLPSSEQLIGVGGPVASVVVETRIRLTCEVSGPVLFRGPFAAVTDLDALDYCVLGRDLTNLFAVIIDRPQDVVCLIGQHHQYTITMP